MGSMVYQNVRSESNIFKKKTNETATGSLMLMSPLKHIEVPQREEDCEKGERDRHRKNKF
eukprot:2138765-Amphidinium_carterae.1